MGNKEQKWYESGQLLFGFIFITLGLIFAIYVFVNYLGIHYTGLEFSDKSQFGDLGTVLSGTSGLCFTLAGILYLLHTIKQTKEEMNQTRTIMSSQLVETSFFNLLKNHKEVVLGKVGSFDESIGEIAKNISRYEICLSNKAFPEPIYTSFSPQSYYSRIQHLNNVGISILHLATFIEDQMPIEKKEFFHTTLYYSLSDTEKYLVGMIISVGLAKKVPNYSFYYSEYYNKNSQYKNEKINGYFPPFEFKGLAQKIFALPYLVYDKQLAEYIDAVLPVNYSPAFPIGQITKIKWKANPPKQTAIMAEDDFDPGIQMPKFSELFKKREFCNLLHDYDDIDVKFYVTYRYQDKDFTIALKPVLLIINLFQKDSHDLPEPFILPIYSCDLVFKQQTYYVIRTAVSGE